MEYTGIATSLHDFDELGNLRGSSVQGSQDIAVQKHLISVSEYPLHACCPRIWYVTCVTCRMSNHRTWEISLFLPRGPSLAPYHIGCGPLLPRLYQIYNAEWKTACATYLLFPIFSRRKNRRGITSYISLACLSITSLCVYIYIQHTIPQTAKKRYLHSFSCRTVSFCLVVAC